jgi:hypothetical protein
VRTTVDTFHKLWENELQNKPTVENGVFYVHNLETARNRVRWGTSIHSENKMCRCVERCQHRKNGEEFEIYIPVPEMFGKDINEVVRRGGGTEDGFLLAACGSKKSGGADQRADRDKQPYVVFNYQIFPLDCHPSHPWDRIAVENWASSSFGSLRRKGFRLFGKIFMAVKSDNGLGIYDLTFGKDLIIEIREEDFLPSSPCRCGVECVARKKSLALVTETTPILVFRFQTWRQPQ